MEKSIALLILPRNPGCNHFCAMKFTGERFIPNDDVDMQLSYEHEHRYEYVISLVRGKKVLDIASGEGYGSVAIAGSASEVIGVDIDPEAIQHATEKYKDYANLHFKVGSVTDIPLDDHSVDVAVSFETIEHIAEHDQMINELKRVVKKDGIVIISTPDKKVYTDESGVVNKFHVKELYKDEFSDLLKKRFSHVELCGQRFLTLSSILPIVSEDPVADNLVISGQFPEAHSMYIIAICSDSEIDKSLLKKSLYFNPGMDLYAKDKATLSWASSVHNELMQSQKDYFRLEREYLALKESIQSKDE